MVKWSVRSRGVLLDCGDAVGGERGVLDRILARELGKFDVRADECYALVAGGCAASVFGDEFARVLASPHNGDGEAEPIDHLEEAKASARRIVDFMDKRREVSNGVIGPVESWSGRDAIVVEVPFERERDDLEDADRKREKRMGIHHDRACTKQSLPVVISRRQDDGTNLVRCNECRVHSVVTDKVLMAEPHCYPLP